MATWTNKHWGAAIGAVLVVLIALLGAGTTALIVLFAVLGYFVGKYLDGEIDLEDVRARAQGRGRGRESTPPYTSPHAPAAPADAVPPVTSPRSTPPRVN